MTHRDRLAAWARFARMPKPCGSEAHYRTGCRLQPCKTAHANRIAKARWRARGGKPERRDWLGLAACYNRGCTHAKCKAARAERGRRDRARAREAPPWRALRRG